MHGTLSTQQLASKCVWKWIICHHQHHGHYHDCLRTFVSPRIDLASHQIAPEGWDPLRVSVAWVHAIKGEESGHQKFRKQTNLQEAWRLSKTVYNKAKQKGWVDDDVIRLVKEERKLSLCLQEVWGGQRAALASKGLRDCLCLGPAGTLTSAHVCETAALFFKEHFARRTWITIFAVTHTHKSSFAWALGEREMRRKYTRLLLVIISQINVYYSYSQQQKQ